MHINVLTCLFLVTGLYPIHHGIVDNSFYAPELNQTFYYRNYTTQNPAFWHGEPFWNTVKKANMKSATLFWPGSEIPINGQQPDLWCVHIHPAKLSY